MTLAEIGEAIGLSASAVSDIQQGRSASPRGEAALRLDALHRDKCPGEGCPGEEGSVEETRRKRG